MAEQLNPCPFCGGEPVLKHLDAQDDWWVWCRGCDLGRPSVRHLVHTHEDAIAAWNDRTPAAPRADWAQAPDWAMWWTADAVGDAEWHEVEPIIEQSVWLWPPPGDNMPSPMSWSAGRIDIPLGIDWRLLKERRPEPAA